MSTAKKRNRHGFDPLLYNLHLHRIFPMSTSVIESPTRPALVPGKKYRFSARSAEEAVQIIHDRMGPNARVVAVEQVGGSGLNRLLRSPRLEVIAMIPPPVLTTGTTSMGAGSAKEGTRQKTAFSPPPPKPASSSLEPTPEEKPLLAGGRDLRSILRRLGFSGELLGKFAATIDPRELAEAGWSGKLDRFIEYLWARYHDLPTRTLTGQVAFFGTPGSGITTALCKELTASVFLRAEQPLVATIDHGRSSSTEALSAFCELMQVPLVSEERGSLTPDERVYWDVPGISSRDFDTWDEVGARMDELQIENRVFVTHAAFDSQHLLHLLRTIKTVRPTHLVLTHLDEATHPARLWDFLHSSALCPLFVSESPSVTGGRRDDFHAALLAQIFPSHLNPVSRPAE